MIPDLMPGVRQALGRRSGRISQLLPIKSCEALQRPKNPARHPKPKTPKSELHIIVYYGASPYIYISQHSKHMCTCIYICTYKSVFLASVLGGSHLTEAMKPHRQEQMLNLALAIPSPSPPKPHPFNRFRAYEVVSSGFRTLSFRMIGFL